MIKLSTIIILTSINFLLSSIVGYLNVGSGSWVKIFTNLPGKYEKPGTNAYVVSAKIPVYRIFNWNTNETGHCWYGVSENPTHWVYGMPGFKFTAGTNK